MQDADARIDRHITDGSVILNTTTWVNSSGIVYKNAVVNCDRWQFEADVSRAMQPRIKIYGFVAGKTVFGGHVVVTDKLAAMELVQACRKVVREDIKIIKNELLDDDDDSMPIPHGC